MATNTKDGGCGHTTFGQVLASLLHMIRGTTPPRNSLGAAVSEMQFDALAVCKRDQLDFSDNDEPMHTERHRCRACQQQSPHEERSGVLAIW